MNRYRILRFAIVLSVVLTSALGFSYLSLAHASFNFEVSQAQNTSWPPFVRIIPLASGDDVVVSASGITNVYTKLLADFGSTSHTWSHTDMDYDEKADAYQGVADDALAEICPDPAGCLRIYDDSLSAQEVHGSQVTIPYQFVRVEPGNTPDLALHLTKVRFGSVPFTDEIKHTVMLQMPPILPASLPPGWMLLSHGCYLVESDGQDGDLQASLSIQYDPDAIDWYGIDETALTLLAWDPVIRQWQPLDSFVNSHANHVSASIQQFTAYVLVAPQNSTLWLPAILS